MNVEKDSVVNFLTPTKLVQGTLKPRPKVNLNESQHSHSTNRIKHEAALNNSRNKIANDSLRIEQSFEKSRVKDEDIYLNDSREKSRPGDKNFMLYDTSKTVLRSEDNFKLLVDDKQNIKIAGLQKNDLNIQPIEQEIQPPVGQVLAKISSSYKNSRAESNRVEQANKNLDFSRRKEELPSYNPSTQNINKWEGSIDELNNLMQILKGVRNSLDNQLMHLQEILDNTSKFLADMNEEYLRVKQRILDYTAQVLDASFTRYKQNMVNWIKYEQIEKKTIVIKSQLQKTIKEDELIVKELVKSTKTSKLALSKQQQIEQAIEFYGGIVNEVQLATQQCMRMHPQLKKDKIAAFQQALNDLADF